MLVRAILMKQVDARRKGHPLKLKSAFATSSKGYIYLEALAEPLAREAIQGHTLFPSFSPLTYSFLGLRGFYLGSFNKVPIPQMTSLMSVTVEKRPLVVGQFVRIRRGPLKVSL